MAIQDITINYSAGSTSGDVLVKLRSALVSGVTNLNFTLIEDSISGSSFFVVRHDTPTEPKSRILLPGILIL